MTGYIESSVTTATAGRDGPGDTGKGWAGWVSFAGWMLVLLDTLIVWADTVHGSVTEGPELAR
jgi:hypothetical protein